jgi:hypothetical protein
MVSIAAFQAVDPSLGHRIFFLFALYISYFCIFVLRPDSSTVEATKCDHFGTQIHFKRYF